MLRPKLVVCLAVLEEMVLVPTPENRRLLSRPDRRFSFSKSKVFFEDVWRVMVIVW